MALIQHSALLLPLAVVVALELGSMVALMLGQMAVLVEALGPLFLDHLRQAQEIRLLFLPLKEVMAELQQLLIIPIAAAVVEGQVRLVVMAVVELVETAEMARHLVFLARQSLMRAAGAALRLYRRLEEREALVALVAAGPEVASRSQVPLAQ